jgi:chromosome segregation ATPase
MLRHFLVGCFVFASAAFVCAAQSSSSSSQPSQTPPPAPASSSTTPPEAKTADGKDQPAKKDAAKDTKKPKKVWTEDDISKVGGSISVVGDSSSSGNAKGSSQSTGTSSDNSAQRNEVENYRDQIRQLQAQLDATDKKLDDLRNFKADNTSSSGGINPNHGYSMTPIPDQIKQLEEQKKQIQEKIDAVTDEARKKGIEPGQLR